MKMGAKLRGRRGVACEIGFKIGAKKKIDIFPKTFQLPNKIEIFRKFKFVGVLLLSVYFFFFTMDRKS